jgi:DNA invertase Pin-like site-specific DNA recombinase
MGIKCKKAALYCRLSRDDGTESESNSISNQRDLLTHFCAQNDIEIFDIYIDDGFSGTTFERPSFVRLTADIENGFVGAVIVKDLSRLGRNNALVAFYTEVYCS